MRYLSDKTKEAYDTIEELEQAEQAYDEKLAEKEKKSAERKIASDEVSAAYEHLREVKEEASKIREEANRKAQAMVQEAKDNAQNKLAEFNKNYGAFYVSVNPGRELTSIFDDLFRGFWL